MSIDDLFDWIDRRGIAGVLSAEWGDASYDLHLAGGAVLGASSNLPGDHLGQLLMSRNLLTESQLNEALQVQGETGVFLGKVLLMGGDLDEEDLRGVLEVKVREAVWDLLSWQSGHFHFEERLRSRPEYPIRVPLRPTMELGKLQVRRWRKIRAQIPDTGVRLWVRDSFAVHNPAASERVQLQVDTIVRAAKRGLTVNQMILEHHGRRFQVLSQLSELIERGALAIDRRSECRDAAAEMGRDVAGSARKIASSGDRTRALELTARALHSEPDNEELQSLNRELQRSVFAELSRDLLATFRVPRLLVGRDELEDMELTDNERYLTGRIDGRWDLLSLMRISPIREVDALLTFKRLQERGIIEL